MTNKTVLILGATSDIGFCIAELYQKEGSTLLLAARNTTALNDRMKNTAWTNTTVHAFDAKDFSSHKSWFNALPVVPDVTICVFGYLGDAAKAETDWNEANEIIDANYKGCVSILNAVAGAYEKRGSGTIVGISSVAGDRGRQTNLIYGSAKAGFTAYLSGLRNKLFKKGIAVVTVKPGFVDTKMTKNLALPKSLTAKPMQVAKTTVAAAKSGKSVVYVLPAWALIMLIIRTMPEFIFKRLKL